MEVVVDSWRERPPGATGGVIVLLPNGKQPGVTAHVARPATGASIRFVLLYFDESGDFAFPTGPVGPVVNPFDCYVQAALIEQ